MPRSIATPWRPPTTIAIESRRRKRASPTRVVERRARATDDVDGDDFEDTTDDRGVRTRAHGASSTNVVKSPFVDDDVLGRENARVKDVKGTRFRRRAVGGARASASPARARLTRDFEAKRLRDKRHRERLREEDEAIERAMGKKFGKEKSAAFARANAAERGRALVDMFVSLVDDDDVRGVRAAQEVARWALKALDVEGETTEANEGDERRAKRTTRGERSEASASASVVDKASDWLRQYFAIDVVRGENGSTEWRVEAGVEFLIAFAFALAASSRAGAALVERAMNFASLDPLLR